MHPLRTPVVKRRSPPPAPVAAFHLFETVPFDDVCNLQSRLAYEARSRDDGRISVLMAEHEPLITLGRLGSRSDIRIEDEELERRQIEVQFVNRGGGTVLHGPGQLSVFVIAPVARMRWTEGNYLRRLQAAATAALQELGVKADVCPPRLGLWGKSGLLAAFGVAIRHGISLYGFHLNVHSEPRLHARIDSAPGCERPSMGTLLSERATAGRMGNVRITLIQCLAAAFACEHYQVFTGHPLLPPKVEPSRECVLP